MAKEKGISVSRFFESLIANQDEENEFTPPPDSGTAQFVNAVPKADKVADYNYKKLKDRMLEKRYVDDESFN